MPKINPWCNPSRWYEILEVFQQSLVYEVPPYQNETFCRVTGQRFENWREIVWEW